MPNLLKVAASVAPEVERPAAEKLISGDPVFTTWNLEEKDGLYAGIWQSTVGKWHVSYDTCHFPTVDCQIPA